MKITKSQLHKVIQEELQAELNEVQQSQDIPKFIEWYAKLINTPQEEAQVIAPILAQILKPSKLPPTRKMNLVADAFEQMGGDGGVVASQVRKALQQQQKKNQRGNVVDRMKSLEGGQDTVGVPAGGSSPQSGGGAGADLTQALKDIN